MTGVNAGRALQASEILLACLQEAGDDVEAGFAAAEYILALDEQWDSQQDTVSRSILTENRPFHIGEDGYPRDKSKRFLDKYKVAAAARDPSVLAQLLESIPEDQRYKLNSVVNHLQSGGTIHHPKEPPGLSINIDGVTADPAWEKYSVLLVLRQDWEERQEQRDAQRTCANEAIGIIRGEDDDGRRFNTIDAHLKEAGATEAEVRSIARARHAVSTGRRSVESLLELYEEVAESVHRRIDTGYDIDPEVPVPTEPDDLRAQFSVESDQATTQQPEPELELESDRLDRIGLIAEILVSMFGDKSVEVAKKLKAESQRQSSSVVMSINAAFHLDPQGIWHGPNPPSPTGWVQIAPGPAGGLRWAPSNGAALTAAIQTHGFGSQATSAPTPHGPPPATPQAAPSPHAVAHQARAVKANAAYTHAMGVLTTGGVLSPSEKSDLSRHLSVMSKQQLRDLYSSLGGTALITGAQRQPWVHAIKGILTGVTPPPTPAMQAAQGLPVTPKPSKQAALYVAPNQPATTTQPTSNFPPVPMRDETTWETGKAQPGTLNGVDFAPAPPKFWERAKDVDVGEPPPLKKIDRVSVIVREPDGRIWIVKPTNEFGNRKHTLPGGGAEYGLSTQQNAMKEVWEETGLQVEITGFVGDFEDSNTKRNGRLYTAKRVGGAPWEAKIEPHITNHATGQPAAESERVSLVTLSRASKLLHRTDDLAQLAMMHPIDIKTKPTGNVIDKIVRGVQSKAQAYIATKKAAGESEGDATLHVIQEARGFNKKPTVVDKQNFDSLMTRGGHIELLRGIAERPPSSAHTKSQLTPAQMAEQFKTGDHFPGHGMYGVGTYADATKGSNNVASTGYSTGGEVIRIAMPKTAKIIKFSELKNHTGRSHPNAYKVPSGKSKTDYWRGIHAALAGYDAIEIDNSYNGNAYYVILNRGILTVQDKAPPKGYQIT